MRQKDQEHLLRRWGVAALPPLLAGIQPPVAAESPRHVTRWTELQQGAGILLLDDEQVPVLEQDNTLGVGPVGITPRLSQPVGPDIVGDVEGDVRQHPSLPGIDVLGPARGLLDQQHAQGAIHRDGLQLGICPGDPRSPCLAQTQGLPIEVVDPLAHSRPGDGGRPVTDGSHGYVPISVPADGQP